MPRALHVATLLLTIILLTACRQTNDKQQANTLFHQFKHLENTPWQRDDTITLTLPSVDTLTHTQASLSLRTLPSFPFTTLRLAILIDNTAHTQRQLIDIPIYPPDNKNNTRTTPLGIETQTPIADITLYPHQTTTLRITHTMWQHAIPGIRAIGIQLQHTP